MSCARVCGWLLAVLALTGGLLAVFLLKQEYDEQYPKNFDTWRAAVESVNEDCANPATVAKKGLHKHCAEARVNAAISPSRATLAAVVKSYRLCNIMDCDYWTHHLADSLGKIFFWGVLFAALMLVLGCFNMFTAYRAGYVNYHALPTAQSHHHGASEDYYEAPSWRGKHGKAH